MEITVIKTVVSLMGFVINDLFMCTGCPKVLLLHNGNFLQIVHEFK